MGISLKNIKWHEASISAQQRALQKRQKPCLVWLTGLSGSGKSTLASALDHALYQRGLHSYILDGDNIRHGISRDLGFSAEDRTENIRRVGEVAKLMVDAGLIVISAMISPYRSDRKLVRELFSAGEFIEVHVSTPIEVCEARDPKGMYRKARAGKIKNFTGIDSPYEAPVSAEVSVDTSCLALSSSVDYVLNVIESLNKGVTTERV